MDRDIFCIAMVSMLVICMMLFSLRQGYEDVLRHRADRVVNNRPVHVLRAGRLQTIKSKHVQVSLAGRLLKLQTWGHMHGAPIATLTVR